MVKKMEPEDSELVSQPGPSIMPEELLEHRTLDVDPGQSPLRIDRYLLDRLMGISRNRIQVGIRSGAILVNDQTVKPNYKVRPGDHISIVFPKSVDTDHGVKPEDIPLDIVYEDDDLLVVDKPAGMVVHPGIGNPSGTLVNALAHHMEQLDLPILAGNTRDRPGLVHRIDKNTSGLLVVAKTEYTLTHLAKQFFDHTVERLYVALIWGQPDHVEGTIDVPIGRDLKDRLKQKAYPEGEMGKRAVTHYKLIEPMYYVSLVHCWLETGRTHQIRVHMSHLGHPLFGDTRYGGDRIVKGTVFQKYRQFVKNGFEVMPYQALHAAVLGFTHPHSGERLRFEIPTPDNFDLLLAKWRTYLSSRKS